MEVYELSPWADKYKENAQKIHSIACQINNMSKRIKSHDITADKANKLTSNIITVINNWTGSTYIGVKKKKELEKAFQAFFIALLELLLEIKKSDYTEFHFIADKILYRGKAYRYLGYPSPEDCNKGIEPTFNDIYVSWSKEHKNSYIESKLYGTMTIISADIIIPYYGIDLEGMGQVLSKLSNENYKMTRGDEREVVFPTIKECITEVNYIEENEENE